VQVSTLRSWQPRAIAVAAADLRGAAHALSTEHDGLARHFEGLGAAWTGGAASSCQGQGGRRRQSLTATTHALVASATVLAAAAESLAAAQRTLATAEAVAASAGLVLHNDGRVTIPAAVLQTADGDSAVTRLGIAARVATSLARRALSEAAAADARGARGLQQATDLAARAGMTGLDAASDMAATAHGDALRSLIAAGLVPDIRLQQIPPLTRSDPNAAAQWWRSLSADQQALQVRAMPKVIGNLDGIPIAARDQANRIVLTAELAQARAESTRMMSDLRAQAPALGRGVALGMEDARRWQSLRRKVAMLESVYNNVAGHPQRRLMLLDTTLPGRVAIAIGDVDRAQHVAVVVPGLQQDVTEDLGRVVRNADRLEQTMERLSSASAGGSTATVAWLGYRTPDFGGVAFDDRAKTGAVHLRANLAGLEASRQAARGPDDPPLHLTLVGHSYGSLTAGIAVRAASPVDELVILGSPGVGVDNVAALAGVPAGHVYVGEAGGDVVADLAYFGSDPSHRSFGAVNFRTHPGVDLVTGAGTRGSYGHSQYFDLNTSSAQNISLIALGRPELVPYVRRYDKPW